MFIENSEGVSVQGCVFERVDGNALMLSSYNRNATIDGNEFVWIGATAVAAWGNTDGGDTRLPPGYGLDGSAGNQPRGCRITNNLCHELGIWEKQASFYTQFKASENIISGNIMYNGPRAHVNVRSRVEGCVRRRSARVSPHHFPIHSLTMASVAVRCCNRTSSLTRAASRGAWAAWRARARARFLQLGLTTHAPTSVSSQ